MVPPQIEWQVMRDFGPRYGEFRLATDIGLTGATNLGPLLRQDEAPTVPPPIGDLLDC